MASFQDYCSSGDIQTVVLYGTSLSDDNSGADTWHWTNLLRQQLSSTGCTVLTRGQRGQDSNFGLAHFSSVVLAENPDAVFIEFGINDAFFHIGETQSYNNAAAMVQMAKASGVKYIFLEVMNTPSFELAAAHAGIGGYYAQYRALAADEGVGLIDYSPAWTSVVAQGETYYKLRVPDDCHPNALGSSDVIFPSMLSAISAPITLLTGGSMSNFGPVNCLSDDGSIRHVASKGSYTWGQTVGATSASSNLNNGGTSFILYTYDISGNWLIERGFVHFDTSAIPSGSTITAGTLTVKCLAVYDSPPRTVKLYISTKGDGDLVASDYSKFGALASSDEVTFTGAGAYTYALNGAALNAITSGAGGRAKFCLRLIDDANGTAPTANAGVSFSASESGNSSTLSLTYTDPPAGGWPDNVATDALLFQAVNNLSTTLNGAIDNVTTTVVLTDASAFPAVGFATIGTEAIKYTGISVNTLTGVTRGADGTVAASHLNGTAVNHYAVAAHHNATKDEIIAIETQLAAEMAATKEPTGFPDASTTTISVVDGTRTFTIAPTGASFDVYVAGKKFTKTSENVTFTDTEGVWYFYYNASGVLTASQTAWDLALAAPVSLLYWNATDNVSLDLADERHGCAMDWATHQYLHTTVGTRFVDGLAASGYVLNSAVNADVRFAFSAGHISDEDLRITIAAQTEPAQIPVFSRAGVGGLWKRATATDYPYLTTGTGRIAYNLNTAGTWSQAEVTNGDFCAYWIFATNGVNYPIISIQGQRQDTSLANAQNNNLYESLSFGTLPYAEMKLLYRVIVQTSNAYGSTMKVRVVDVQDLRSVSNLPSGSYVATDHGSLSGRTAAGSHPATAISNTPAGTIAATDVQAAIDELGTEKVAKAGDTMTGALQITIPGSDQGLLITDGGANFNPQFTMSRNGTSVVKMTGASGVGTITGGSGLSLGGALDTAHVEIDSSGRTYVKNSGGVSLKALRASRFGYSSGYQTLIVGDTTSGSQTICLGYDPLANTSGSFNGDGRDILVRNGMHIITPTAADTDFYTNHMVLKDGNVGIGTAVPSGRLHIKGATNENLTIGGHLGIAAGVSISAQDDGPSANVPLEIRASKTTFTGGGVGGEVAMPGVYANTDASAANVYVDSSGNLKRSTASAGGGGTVNSGTAAQLAYYATTGTAVSGASEIVTDGDQLVIGSSTISNINRLQIYNSLAAYGISVEASQGNTIDSAKMIFQAWDSADKSNALVIAASNSGTTGSTIYTTTNTSTGDLFLSLEAGGVSGIKMHSTSNQIETKGAGTVSVPQFVLNGDTNTGIWAPAADTWAVSTNGVEAMRISSAQRVGIGRSPVNYPLEVQVTSAATNTVQTAAVFCSSTSGTPAAGLGTSINFAVESSSGAISEVADILVVTTAVTAGSQSADIIFNSQQAGSYTERLRLIGSNGYVRAVGVYNQTTGNSANVYVDSSGNLMRSTSSLRYKTTIHEVTQEEAAKLLDLTPVTYASTCESDKDERHYGFIAEELDLIDPLLVSYKTLADGTKVPDGVQYERVVVGLLKLVQDLTKRVADLEAKQA